MNRLFYLTPLIIAMSPVLFLWYHNVEKTQTQGLGLIILSFILVSSVPIIIVFTVVRNSYRSIVLSSILISLFFTHGHILHLLISISNFNNFYVLNGVLVICYLILIVLTHRSLSKRDNIKPLVKFFFIYGLLMVCWPTYGILKFHFFDKSHYERNIAIPDNLQNLTPEENVSEELPDIYYIILDGYCREDILKSSYGYDNSPFIRSLEERGFYIGSQSTSNYPYTHLSLASTLNLQYFNDKTGITPVEAYPLIHDNIAARYLKKKGYQYITINTNWSGTEISKIADIQYKKLFSNEFLAVLLNRSVAQILMPSFAELHLFSFASLKEISLLESPKFVFAHFILPHSPYVFDAEGKELLDTLDTPSELIWEKKDMSLAGQKAYIEQLKFTNKKVIELIDTLVSNSRKKPIIIIQSDHGWETVERSQKDQQYLTERYSILNAWLVHDDIKNQLTNNMTSVNTFRTLFSSLFNDNYPELEIHSFYPNDALTEQINITNFLKVETK